MSIPILMYHSISDSYTASQRLWTISPTIFASHLAYLKDQGYVALSVSGLISTIYGKNNTLPDKPVVITFDDGRVDFFSGALPVLDKYEFPTTLFIPTAYVNQTCHWLKAPEDRNYPMLSWSEIQEIADHGIEIGSHGHTHRQLDILPAKQMWEEVTHSKDILEQHLQESVESFAYPSGLNCANLRKIVQQAGYLSGCAVKHSLMTDADDRYALARIIITSEINQTRYQDLLIGKGLRKTYKNERTKTKIYRFIRILKSRLNLK